VTDTIQSYDLNFHPVPHGVTEFCERYIMGFLVCYVSQKHHKCREGERRGKWWRVTLHVQTHLGLDCIIHLTRWPNTDSAPNMPVTLPTWTRVPSTLSRYGVTIRGNVTSVYPPFTGFCLVTDTLFPGSPCQTSEFVARNRESGQKKKVNVRSLCMICWKWCRLFR
jgi:hypothetical protein